MEKKEMTLFDEIAYKEYGKAFNELDVCDRLEVNLVVMTMEMKGEVR